MMTPKEILNWPVTTGCFRLSPGCNSCPSYWNYVAEGKDYSPVQHKETLTIPLKNPTPSNYEVAFGSDLFHADVDFDFQKKVFDVMNRANWHNFSVGTKRIGRALISGGQLGWSDNITLTVPVESRDFEWRIKLLQKSQAKRKIISVTPMLGPFSSDLDLTGIDGVGIAGETWGYKRPFVNQWAADLALQCVAQGVPVFDETIVYTEEGREKYVAS